MVVAVGSTSCSISSRFGTSSAFKLLTPREVAARPAQADNKPHCDRVYSCDEYDRNCRSGGLCRLRRGTSAGRGNDGYPTIDEIGGQRRQSIALAGGPTKFDGHVLALDETGLGQTLSERGQKLRVVTGRSDT